ncbi:hypothetical protein MTO96_011504 [Rhipicephalus appendiculatus]
MLHAYDAIEEESDDVEHHTIRLLLAQPQDPGGPREEPAPGLPNAWVAAIAVNAALVALFLVFVLYCYIRSRKREQPYFCTLSVFLLPNTRINAMRMPEFTQ